MLNTNPPRQEADRQSKSKHSEILLKSKLFWPEPRSDEWQFLSLELSMLCYALMDSIVPYTNPEGVAVAGGTNAVNMKQSEAVTVSLFFPPPHPHAFNPISPIPTGILYSPQFRSHQETKMAARRTQRSTSTISWENRGL